MIDAPIASDLVIRKNPLPTDTFEAVCEVYIPRAIKQTQPFVAKFQHHPDPLRAIYDWCRDTFQYQEDRLGYEEIRLPRQSWKDRRTGIDCEDFVILISGILHHLRLSHTVRMADYGSGWQHIYVVVGDTILDPVNPVFNQEPPFQKKKDHAFALGQLGAIPLKFPFVRQIQSELAQGETYTRTKLENIAKKEFGIEDKQLVKELIELAYLQQALHIASDYKLERKIAYDEIVQLYQTQANSSLRTSESVMLQQYSTPLPICYLMGLFCGIDNNMNHFFEPSAGNGFMMVASGLSHKRGSVMNEISPNRVENLELMADLYKFRVTKEDATEPQYYASLPKFPVVIGNPPFGLMKRRTFDKITTQKLDHWIILNALSRMYDNGRAAFVLGGHMRYDHEGRISSKDKSTGDRYFFNYLYHHYKVVDVINVNGDLYSRQGTKFDVRILLIDGRKKTPEGYAPLLENANLQVVGSYGDLWRRIAPFFRHDPSSFSNLPVKAFIFHNESRNGIEIKFENKPLVENLAWLREQGYKWTNRGYWYITYSPQQWQLIHEKFRENTAPDLALLEMEAQALELELQLLNLS